MIKPSSCTSLKVQKRLKPVIMCYRSWEQQKQWKTLRACNPIIENVKPTKIKGFQKLKQSPLKQPPKYTQSNTQNTSLKVQEHLKCVIRCYSSWKIQKQLKILTYVTPLLKASKTI